jgi:hypothetical protein
LIVNVVKEATPPVAANDVCPPSVHDEVIPTVSVLDTRLPYWSSTLTVNGSAVCAWAVAAGSVVKASLWLVAEGVTVTVTAGDVVPPVGVSAADSAHEPVLALLRMMAAKVAFPEVPVTGYVRLPLGDKVQFVEESVMVSPLTAFEKATVKFVVAFATTDGGGLVNDIVAAAEAGSTPINATPANTRAAAEPIPSADPSFDLTERTFPVQPKCIPITSP